MSHSVSGLSPQQLDVLFALADGLIPSLTAEEMAAAKKKIEATVLDPDWGAVDEFLAESCSANENFRRLMEKILGELPAKAKAPLGGFFDLLSNGGPVAAPMTGTETPVQELPRVERTKILQQWSESDVAELQSAFASLKRLTAMTYLKTSEKARKAMEYPDHNAIRGPVPPFHAFNFTEIEDLGAENEPRTIDADVVIIGSGAGGAVVAAKLASRYGQTKRILVLDQGKFIAPERFPMSQEDSAEIFGHIGAYLTTDEHGIIVAGHTWGGSTVVNWSGALELPSVARKEWADEFGLEFASGDEFQRCYDRVSERVGASTENIKHNGPNQVLVDGATRLGIPYATVPQNTGGREHYCGLCQFGCRSGAKRSTASTFLVDAERDGAKCLQGCQVERILLDGSKKVTGLAATKDGVPVVINSPKVVVAAGGIGTPCVLKKSGVENDYIGKNLKVHPSIFCLGSYDNKLLKGWEGSCMTATVPAYQDPEHPGYAAKIININPWPAYSTFMIPWADPAAWKASILRSKQGAWADVTVRDRTSVGRVDVDGDSGKAVISYDLSDADRTYVIEGMLVAIKLLVAAGCDEAWPILFGGDKQTAPYRVDPAHSTVEERLNDERLGQYLDYVRQHESTDNSWGSAHPMGTCRMGNDPATSAVDLGGHVWGYEGLYVADASLLPTATGANPMLTVMAMADWVGERIADEGI